MISGVSHITFAVSDLSRSVAFYSDILGCSETKRWRGGAYLKAGDLWLCLSLDPNAGDQQRSDYTHVAFDVSTESYDELEQRILSANDAKLWKVNRSEGASLYILDPDGHKLEIHVGTLTSRLAAMNNDSTAS